MGLFEKFFASRARRRPAVPRTYLSLEALESRLTPYAATGNAWPVPQLVTISFVPDGTVLGQSFNGPITSNMFATFNQKFGSPSVWENAILKAAQAWAQQTNINLAVVSDNGTVSGGGNYQQGDPGMGDIRIGGYNFGNGYLAMTELPPPINNYSVAGDLAFNTASAFTMGTSGGYNLQTVAEHEFGHALGLGHTNVTSAAVMWPSYTNYKVTLNADDVAGIRNIYSANNPRAADQYDAILPNDSLLTATNVTAAIDPVALTALVNNADITTTSDADYYSFLAPVLTTGTLTVNVQSTGLSLLSPKMTVYGADGFTVLGSANGAGQYGTTLSVTVNNVSPLQLMYVKVQGADGTAMSTGAYAMTLNFGTGASPTVPLPNTQTLNGNPISSGGGLALSWLQWLTQWSQSLSISPAMMMSAGPGIANTTGDGLEASGDPSSPPHGSTHAVQSDFGLLPGLLSAEHAPVFASPAPSLTVSTPASTATPHSSDSSTGPAVAASEQAGLASSHHGSGTSLDQQALDSFFAALGSGGGHDHDPGLFA